MILDGELIAYGDDGRPDFPRLSERMRHGRDGIRIRLMGAYWRYPAELEAVRRSVEPRHHTLTWRSLDIPRPQVVHIAR